MRRRKRRLRGPWKGVQTAIWLIGLAILALTDWWWPGILALVAVSVLAQAVIEKSVPEAMEEVELEEPKEPFEFPTPAPVAPIAPMAEPQYPTGRLPADCPKCGGPVRGHEARWTGLDSADCPYCGANLPLAAVK